MPIDPQVALTAFPVLVVLGATLIVAGLIPLLFATADRFGIVRTGSAIRFWQIAGMSAPGGAAMALGLAGGLAGGVLVVWSNRLAGVGWFTLTGGFGAGLALGVGCGAVGGLWLARARALPRGLTLGVLAGLASGLVLFRLIFGATAGYGPETDIGVGTEVGVIFGLVGALAGGLTGTLIDALFAARSASVAGASPDVVPDVVPSAAPESTRAVVLRTALGAGVGATLTGFVALAGWLGGAFSFILPYYGGITDRQPTTNLSTALGVVYGVGIIALTGGLIGGLAGALASVERRQESRARVERRIGWATTVVGLALGLFVGLTEGLAHAEVGGPLLTSMIAYSTPIFDPVASQIGFGTGLLGGVLVAGAGALALRWAGRRHERRRERQALVTAGFLMALGIVVLLMPAWFHPLYGIDIP